MTLYSSLFILSGIIMMAYFILIVIQILYTYKGQKSPEYEESNEGVSVIIPFKNEEENIERLIQDLDRLMSNEENFEVIFVNDNSEDSTVSKIKRKSSTGHRLLDSVGVGKKMALKTGIQNATYDVIATLDADVRITEKWLLEIRNFFLGKDQCFLILPILTIGENNIAGHLEALDVMALAGTTLSWANMNNAVMCNGANMAFKKSLFEEHRLQGVDEQLISGDDVFFLHQVKSKSNVSVGAVFNQNTIARTSAFNSFRHLLNQRARWTSKSFYYTDKTTLTIAWLVLLTNILILLLGILSVWKNKLINLFLIVFISKFIIDFIYLLLLSIKFKKSNSLIYYPLVVIIQFVFVPLVFIKSKWGSFEWKGRRYNK